MKETVPSEETVKAFGQRKSVRISATRRLAFENPRLQISIIAGTASIPVSAMASMKKRAMGSPVPQPMSRIVRSGAMSDRSFEPWSLAQRSGPVPNPRLGVPVVKVDDVFCFAGQRHHLLSFCDGARTADVG
jgi:hypothetical protein